MRKLLIIGATLLGFALFAQEGTHISSAIIAVDQRADLPEAKRYIDQAREIIDGKDAASVSKKNMGKYLHYYGKIHWLIFKSQDEDLQALDDQALDKALEYLFKSYQYETSINKNYFRSITEQFLPAVLPEIVQRGFSFEAQSKVAMKEENEALAKEMRLLAYNDFMKAYEYGQKAPLNRADTSLFYNSGFMMFQNKEYDKAIEHFEKLIEMGYKGIAFEAKNKQSGKYEVFPSQRMAEGAVAKGSHEDMRMTDDITPDLYKSLAMSHRLKGDNERYRATLSRARSLFPQNEELIREELQVFLDAGEFDKAIANIDASLELDPSNALFIYIKATLLYKDVKDIDAAYAAYQDVLKIEPKHPEANYMLGVIYIDRANQLVEPMNKLGTSASDMKKFDALKAKQKKLFQEALPYFETAYEINPEDPDVLRAIQQVYFKTGNQKRAMEIQAQLKAMEQ